MKISYQSPDRLMLDHTPWIMGGLFAAGILLVAGFGLAGLFAGDLGSALGGLAGTAFLGLFLVLFVRRVQVILDRPAGTVSIRRRDALRSTHEVFPLAEVQRAMVQTSYGDDGKTHRAALRLEGRNVAVPLTLVYASGSAAEHAVRAINDWLQAGAREPPGSG